MLLILGVAIVHPVIAFMSFVENLVIMVESLYKSCKIRGYDYISSINDFTILFPQVS